MSKQKKPPTLNGLEYGAIETVINLYVVCACKLLKLSCDSKSREAKVVAMNSMWSLLWAIKTFEQHPNELNLGHFTNWIENLKQYADKQLTDINAVEERDYLEMLYYYQRRKEK